MNTRTISTANIGIVGPLPRDLNTLGLRFSMSRDDIISIVSSRRVLKNPFRRYQRVNVVNEGECTVCLADSQTLYLCPEDKGCQAKCCRGCIEYYADLSNTCSCSTCGYTFTMGDISLIYGNKASIIKSTLLRHKIQSLVTIYDKYLPRTAKRLSLARELSSITGSSVTDVPVIALLLSRDEDIMDRYLVGIDQYHQDVWRDLLIAAKNTKVVDRCKSCNYDIEEVLHSRIGAAGYTTYDCVHCTNRLCKSCGIVYDRTRQIHRCTRNDVLSFRMLTSNSRKCPNCFVYVMKSHGCDDMWCTECKTTFNWETGDITEGRRHNPEHSDFLVHMYDNISIKDPVDGIPRIFYYSSLDNALQGNVVKDHLYDIYDDDTQALEKAVLSNILNHLSDVSHTLLRLDEALQMVTVIDPYIGECPRIQYLLNSNKKSASTLYKKQMTEIAMNMFAKRYICHAIQDLRQSLLRYYRYIVNNPSTKYTAEHLYIQYCREIHECDTTIRAIYSYFNVHTNKRVDLYKVLYENSNGSSYSYYNRTTGVIIPIEYTIYNEIVRDKLPSAMVDHIKTTLHSYIA